MGCFDSVMVSCPKCGELNEFQSKGSEDCCQRVFVLGNDQIPMDVLSDVNRHIHPPYKPTCSKCGTAFAVSVNLQPEIKLILNFKVTAVPVTLPHHESLDPPASIEDTLELAEWPTDSHTRPIQCSTCTFWQPGLASRPELGLCMQSYLAEGKTKMQITAHGTFDEEGRLETKPDFGCVQYYPRDSDEEAQTTPR